MKIDKRNYRHWLYLTGFSVNVIVALTLRPFKQKKPLAILYGHKLNGNLKAIYDYHKAQPNPEMELVFLTMDPVYHQQLKASGVDSVYAISPTAINAISYAKCVVSDHGLHALEAALYFSDIKFVDVWHGIPFKGFDKDDFRVQRKYDEVYVTSEFLKDIYISQFGFSKNKVFTTGYARTDVLTHNNHKDKGILNALGISDHDRKIVLFAPTWGQDSQHRSIFPFNSNEEDFIGMLNDMAQQENATVIIRTHLNNTLQCDAAFKNILHLPTATHPNTEEILRITDLLICDWSSIAFDFILLNRPALFLNVPPPFKKGFSVSPLYRYGVIVESLSELKTQCKLHLKNGNSNYNEPLSKRGAIIKRIYDNNLDGNSSRRCYDRLEKLCML